MTPAERLEKLGAIPTRYALPGITLSAGYGELYSIQNDDTLRYWVRGSRPLQIRSSGGRWMALDEHGSFVWTLEEALSEIESGRVW